MSNTRTTTRPKPAVKRSKIFDVDALEREVVHEPFVARVGGRDYTFPDPTDMDWQDAISLDPNDIVASFREWLGEDEYTEFAKHRMSLWKLVELAKAVQEHYGLTPEAEGKDSGSAGS
jgi:hypothetical protein